MTKDRDRTLECLRCGSTLELRGKRVFREGETFNPMAQMFQDLTGRKERYVVFVCPTCGHVELFADGVGDPHRSS